MDTTGTAVTAIGLGAMPLSLSGRPDERSAIAVIAKFVEAGGDFIDTANVYCLDTKDLGHNERLIHKALREIGAIDRVRVASKGGLTKEGSGWDTDGRPQWLRTSCERSLRDLGTDRIFLYQLHAPDPAVAFSDSVAELARLREEGKVEHIGLSNVEMHHIEQALKIAPIASVQNKLHVFCKKSVRNGVLDLCRDKGIAFIAHSPVGGHMSHRRLPDSVELRSMSAKYRVTPYQLALAWLLQKGENLIAIPGASRTASVLASLEAMSVQIEARDIARLDGLSDW
ncbi:MAG: aldo/keto reductase [Gammaproteobacteria bacterium]